jgi:hypothetical protein
MDFCAGQAGEHLQRPGEVELRYFGKDEETDLKRRGHGDFLRQGLTPASCHDGLMS